MAFDKSIPLNFRVTICQRVSVYKITLVVQLVKNPPARQETPSSIPGLGRSAGEGIDYPLQYSWASLVAQMVKNHLQCGRPGFDHRFGKISWRR